MAEILNFSRIEKTIYISLRHKKFHVQKGGYSLAHFLENFKKVKTEVTGPKKAQQKRFQVLSDFIF